MTQENAVDLILRKHSKFAEVYITYQKLHSALKKRDVEELTSTISSYENTITAMDQTIHTLHRSVHFVANSAKYDYSNGPLEGINCGFRNFENLLRRIECIRYLKNPHFNYEAGNRSSPIRFDKDPIFKIANFILGSVKYFV